MLRYRISSSGSCVTKLLGLGSVNAWILLTFLGDVFSFFPLTLSKLIPDPPRKMLLCHSIINCHQDCSVTLWEQPS